MERRREPDGEPKRVNWHASAEAAAKFADRWPGSPLRQALAADSVDDVRRLLEEGHDPNDASDTPSGWTLLMFAVDGAGQPEIVEALLRGGADPNIGDRQGFNAMHLAVDAACMEAQNLSGEPDWTCFNLLEQFGGRRDIAAADGMNPTLIADLYGQGLPPQPEEDPFQE